MAILVNPPCVIFEDEHLLIVNKPPGWNTHSPAPYAGEGIYEWLKNREPRWAKLAIIHRLDKETSGLLIFTKTSEANRSLTEQFTNRKVHKEYILQSAARPKRDKFVVNSRLKRAGDKYVSVQGGVSGDEAETEFEVLSGGAGEWLIAARPRTGRTHQIRVHAAENGFAIMGDTLYGGASHPRLCLHARSIRFLHPATGEGVTYDVMQPFGAPAWAILRRGGCIVRDETNACRMIHGASDDFTCWYVDEFGDVLLSQSAEPLSTERLDALRKWISRKSIYHKTTTSHIRGKTAEEASPRHVEGKTIDGPFTIRENGVQYEINFAEGYSVGIFLDQRDNRRRLLANYVAPDFLVRDVGLNGAEILNTFAYTCAFSVCAALSGARVTSLDLSKKYLEWGQRNFRLNNIDPDQHDFIYGDVFDWLRRFAKKQRAFDVVLLDPPTFSKSKESGIWRAETDYARLITEALKVLRPGGTLFASSNAARWPAENFVEAIRKAIRESGRNVLREQYIPQPPDFPISREEPAYLKTLWLRVG